MYAYLQTGQDAAARRMVDEAPRVLARLDPNAMGGAAPGVAGLYAAAAIPARYALERGAWSDAAALQPQATAFPYVDALTRFARAVGAARSGKPDAARADVAELGVLTEKLVAARDADWSEKVGIQQQIASAWVAFAEGRKAEAVELLRKAADAEDATDKSAISPGPLAPARELLGEMLLTVDRPARRVEGIRGDDEEGAEPVPRHLQRGEGRVARRRPRQGAAVLPAAPRAFAKRATHPDVRSWNRRENSWRPDPPSLVARPNESDKLWRGRHERCSAEHVRPQRSSNRIRPAQRASVVVI